jgi:hypothetical protein
LAFAAILFVAMAVAVGSLSSHYLSSFFSLFVVFQQFVQLG